MMFTSYRVSKIVLMIALMLAIMIVATPSIARADGPVAGQSVTTAQGNPPGGGATGSITAGFAPVVPFLRLPIVQPKVDTREIVSLPVDAVKQRAYNECGVGALTAMILATHPDANVNQVYSDVGGFLQENNLIDSNGTSLAGLALAAQQYGLNANAVDFAGQPNAKQQAWSWLKTQLSAGQPVLTATRLNANAQEARHFMVATGFTADGRVIANDPADGKTKYYTQEEWLNAWGTQEYRGMTLSDATAPTNTDNGGLPNALGLLLALFTAGAVAPALAMAREYLRLGIGVGAVAEDGGDGGDGSPPAGPPPPKPDVWTFVIDIVSLIGSIAELFPPTAIPGLITTDVGGWLGVYRTATNDPNAVQITSQNGNARVTISNDLAIAIFDATVGMMPGPVSVGTDGIQLVYDIGTANDWIPSGDFTIEVPQPW